MGYAGTNFVNEVNAENDVNRSGGSAVDVCII